MLNCNGGVCCFREYQILNNVGHCQLHNIPYMFICNNKVISCQMNPLMCHQCLAMHKGHPFQALQHHFTQEFRNILKQGTSLNGPAVARLNDHLLSDFKKMKAKLTNQLDKFQLTIKKQISKIFPKYPVKDVFGIPGQQINKNNILILNDIQTRQKNHIWVPATQKYMRSLVGGVTTMIGNLLNDLDQNIMNKPYEGFTQVQSAMLVQQFMKKYQGRYDLDRHYFQWSQHEKHDNVKIHQDGLIAKYVHNSPAKPGALMKNSFTRTMDKVYVKITKLPSAAIVFDASTIALGVCVPSTAKTFGYKQLIQPAHGSFMIASNGKCYHSVLDKYSRKSLSFSFGKSDTVCISIDFDKKLVKFSKWGFFQRNFQMQLPLKDQDLYSLRPCVMFHGQVGAMVHIVNQMVYRNKQEQEVFQV